MHAIKAVGLTKRYGRINAVDGLDLEIKAGELFALLGVNGAGKTTTIKMLTCICTPDAGEAFVGGYSILREPSEVKRLIAVSPQESAVAPNLSVEENLRMICGIHGFSRERTEEKLGELLGRLGLESVAKRRAGKLSGGWRRRVSIAMALISEPSVLFLDEPTLGLDVLAKQELRETVRRLAGEVTVVLTTHDMTEARLLSDRIGIMKSGRLLTVGTVSELCQRAGTAEFEDAFIRIVREDDLCDA